MLSLMAFGILISLPKHLKLNKKLTEISINVFSTTSPAAW